MVARADDLHRSGFQTFGEPDGVGRGEPAPDAWSQTEIGAELGDGFVLCALHPDRDLAAAQVDESTGVDPRDGRVTVDERREYAESRSLPCDLDPDARSLPSATSVRNAFAPSAVDVSTLPTTMPDTGTRYFAS